MKSIRVHQTGEPEVLRLEEVPDLKPMTGQVVVKVQAIGVNPVEVYIRSGKYPVKVSFPYTPGSDCAGTIESVGPGQTPFKSGDRVYTASTLSGAYAEKALCDVKSVYPLPQAATFQQGAALGVPYATAYQALFKRAQGRAGETVLVHGASGGVGTAAVQLALAAGFLVVGTAGTEKGRTQVSEQGAHHVLDHTSGDYLQKLLDITGGRGVDIILEMLANVNLAKDLTVLAKYGRVIVIGNRGEATINARDIMSRDADIRAMTLMNATEADLHGIHSALIAGLENGSLRPIIGREFSLSQAANAHRAVMEPGSRGKIVLVP
jgi:NADPH2:quinone reductase